jgi:hypothetical protein
MIPVLVSVLLQTIRLLSQLAARLPDIVGLLQPNYDDSAAIIIRQGLAQVGLNRKIHSWQPLVMTAGDEHHLERQVACTHSELDVRVCTCRKQRGTANVPPAQKLHRGAEVESLPTTQSTCVLMCWACAQHLATQILKHCMCKGPSAVPQSLL